MTPMTFVDQKISAWAGLASTALLGVALLIAGFVPPPGPGLTAEEVAGLYQDHASSIRIGMIVALFAIAGYTALIGAISVQLHRIPGTSLLPSFLQLSAGSIGILTLLFPFMLFAVAAFRPQRDPQLLQLLNDIGWLVAVPAFPTFIVQWGAITSGVLQDRGPARVYPRWIAFFNVWVAVLTLTAPLAYFFHSGPFAWNGLFPFWLAGCVFFMWMAVMSWFTLSAIHQQERQLDARST